MQILTINLPKRLADAITCNLGVTVCQTDNIKEACHLIENEDFNIIIKFSNESSSQAGPLNTLLGLTPISTKIFLVEGPIEAANRSSWEELGIEFLANPTPDELISKIQANTCPTPS